MRVHITLRDEVVRELDRRVGPRRRSAFISQAVERALDEQERDDLFRSAFGAIEDTGHEWDADPARWVRQQRYADPRRVG